MKIVHICSRNLSVFEDAIKGTGCCINGSRDIPYLQKSFSNYNVRDVFGLIIFQQHITKRTLRLIKAFDNYFVFSPKPIVLVCDEATALVQAHKIRVKYSPLYVVDSIDGTISDVDIERIFTTLVCESGDMYNLRDVEKSFGLVTSDHRDVSLETAEHVKDTHSKNVVGEAEELLEQLYKLG